MHVDTSNKIAVITSDTYTATQDCWFNGEATADTTVTAKIDNIAFASNRALYLRPLIFLKKGQILYANSFKKTIWGTK